MTTTTVDPVLLLTAVVRSVERLSPSFVRIRLGGEGFEHLGPEGPTLDQRVKLLVPPAGRPVPALDPDDWYAAWLGLPEAERGHLRTYTARAVEGEGARRTLVVDFVLHGRVDDGTAGPAGAWAAAAVAGDEIGLLAPRRGHEHAFGGVEFAPGRARRLVLVADETALPALASIAGTLPADARGVAVVEVPHPEDLYDLRLPPGIETHGLVRGVAPRGAQTLACLRQCLLGSDARAAPAASAEPAAAGSVGAEDTADAAVWETPTYSSSGEEVGPGATGAAPTTPAAHEDTYAWVAGDSDTVKACRRLLVGEGGLPRGQVAFMGYWKAGRAL